MYSKACRCCQPLCVSLPFLCFRRGRIEFRLTLSQRSLGGEDAKQFNADDHNRQVV